MEQEIRLNSAALEKWIEDMEQKLTALRDLLDILETEEKGLKSIWDGGAMGQWERRFGELMQQLRECFGKIRELLAGINESAYALAKLEAEMTDEAEKLSIE